MCTSDYVKKVTCPNVGHFPGRRSIQVEQLKHRQYRTVPHNLGNLVSLYLGHVQKGILKYHKDSLDLKLTYKKNNKYTYKITMFIRVVTKTIGIMSGYTFNVFESCHLSWKTKQQTW